MSNEIMCSNCRKKFSVKVDKVKDKYLGKDVIQFTVQGKEKARYNSIMEAAEKTGINRGGIGRCCKGNQETAGGYIWQYAIKEINQ